MSHADPGTGRRMLATVLFGDIVGSTARLSEIGDARWAELLAAFRAGVTEITGRHGGWYVKSTGDGFLCTFDSASAAAAAAMAIGAAAERLSLQLRQGMHGGEIERRGGDVIGLAVHVAARVCDSAAPDEIRATATVRDLMQGSGIEVAQ